MSVYRKDEFGVIRKTASSLVKRWNDRIFLTIHTVSNGIDYYEIAPEASKYIVSLNDLTEYQLYIDEPNENSTVFITFKGKQLELKISTEDAIIPGRIINNLHCYTLDMSDGYIWTDAPYTVIENYLLDAFNYLRGQNGGARQVSLFGENGNAVITYDDEDILVDYHGLQNKALKTLILEVQPLTAATFTKGMSVMYAGGIGNTGKKLAKPTSLSELRFNPNLFLGVVTKVLPNNNAIVCWYGEIDGLNTSGLISGAPIYVGNNGTWTTVEPQSGVAKITIGTIDKVHLTEGIMNIRPSIGLQLKNLSDVNFTEESVISENDILVFSSELGYWRHVSRDTYLENVVPKSRTIAGIDFQNDITVEELKTAIGVATNLLAGLLSPEDKALIDVYRTLLASDDPDAVINTIQEILNIFSTYPEGVNILTTLSEKVDKVAGKGLSETDLTAILKAAYDEAYAHKQITNGTNPHGTTFENIVDKPTTVAGYGITDAVSQEYVDDLVGDINAILETI